MVKPGDKGNNVGEVQTALKDKKYLTSNQVDKALGPVTHRAIYNATKINLQTSGMNKAELINKINQAEEGTPVKSTPSRRRSRSKTTQESVSSVPAIII